jgi:hypothetical protein
VLLKKAKPAIWDGNRNAPGLELLSVGAERGNYPEAKPKRKGRKGRRACNDASSRSGCEVASAGSPRYRIELPLRRSERSGKKQHKSILSATWRKLYNRTAIAATFAQRSRRLTLDGADFAVRTIAFCPDMRFLPGAPRIKAEVSAVGSFVSPLLILSRFRSMYLA